MNKYLVSVIIPFFNAELYLSECIESIIQQTKLENIEVLLVDDGSTDRSNEIAKQYSENFNNIYVYTQQNKGVSAARNKGLNLAHGKWITFLDSDDKLCIENLNFLKHTNKEVNLCAFGYLIFSNENSINKHFYGSDCLLTYNQSIKALLSPNSPYQGHVWGKFFLREILNNNNIMFNENICYYEDELFLLDYLRYVNKVQCTTMCNYMYRRRKGQVSDSSSFSNSFLEGFAVRENIINYVHHFWPDYVFYAKAKYMLSVNALVKRIVVTGDISYFSLAKSVFRRDCVFPAIRALGFDFVRQIKLLFVLMLLRWPKFIKILNSFYKRNNNVLI